MFTRCHLLSLVPLVVIRCHSLSFVVPLVVIRCATRCSTRCHSLLLVVTRCTTRLSFYKRSFISFVQHDSVHSEKNTIEIDKISSNSSSVANKTMVQQIVGTSSGAANGQQKQIFVTPGTNQKHPLYPKLRLLSVMCTRDHHKQAHSKRNNHCP